MILCRLSRLAPAKDIYQEYFDLHAVSISMALSHTKTNAMN